MDRPRVRRPDATGPGVPPPMSRTDSGEPRTARPPAAPGGPRSPGEPARTGGTPRRLARNFAALGAAEIACRGTSVAVALALTHRLGPAGYGRAEFAFGVVGWLILLIRDGFDLTGAREVARNPGRIRSLVNHLLGLRLAIAAGLLGLLVAVGCLTLETAGDRGLLALYGLLLLTTGAGLDYAFRGLERMGVIAASLLVRTGVYAAGVGLLVQGPERLAWVPALLVLGEAAGIGLIWAVYARRYGLPRPRLRQSRRVALLLRRGRSVALVQIAQAVLATADLLVVGLLNGWSDVGIYSAPHRLTTAVLTFGLIVPQVAFPGLARAWRSDPERARRALDGCVRWLALGLVPVAVGTTVLAGPLVRLLLHDAFAASAPLLAIGIWRAPLLIVAALYQTALIALNRESSGVRLLVLTAAIAGPMVVVGHALGGLAGAAAVPVLIGLGLVLAGYRGLARLGRAPAWHHHLARPLIAATAMAGACHPLRDRPVLAVLAGAATYGLILLVLEGLRPGCWPRAGDPVAPVGIRAGRWRRQASPSLPSRTGGIPANRV